MVRDDIYITIPNFFRCPISLDVMKSPVSLCTGVTYDRTSIQRWLDGGNNTCPATMQVLQTKDVVPNHTLHRLIQIWSDSDKGRTQPNPPHQLTHDQACGLIQQLTTSLTDDGYDHQKIPNCLVNISKLILFAKESVENRKFLASTDGFSALLVEILCNQFKNMILVEKVIHLLSLILEEYKDKQQLSKLSLANDCLTSMVIVLQKGSLEARIATARVLELISVDVESKFYVAEHKNVLLELLNLVKSEADSNAIEAGLSCLGCILMPKKIRVKMLLLGAVKVLGKMLADSELSVSISEKILKLLEMFSGCTEGRVEICNDENCVPAIVKKVLKVSNVATEHAVTILWCLCCLFRDQKAQEAVTKSNGLAKVLLLMQSNCSPAVRQMSGELMKIFRVNWKCCLSSYDTKTTHIMPF